MSTRTTRSPRVVLTGVMVAACLLPTAELALATTTTSTFSVSIQLVATCTINSAGALNFGNSVGILSANIDQTSQINITCTSGTPFNIGLDAGTATGATVTTRKMTSGGNTVSYALYSDAGRTTNWGNTVGTDTVSVSSGSSNGQATNYTVYGRVPPQTTPPVGTYTDTITVTVTY